MSGASGNFQEQERACTWISKNNIVKKNHELEIPSPWQL